MVWLLHLIGVSPYNVRIPEECGKKRTPPNCFVWLLIYVYLFYVLIFLRPLLSYINNAFCDVILESAIVWFLVL